MYRHRGGKCGQLLDLAVLAQSDVVKDHCDHSLFRLVKTAANPCLDLVRIEVLAAPGKAYPERHRVVFTPRGGVASRSRATNEQGRHLAGMTTCWAR